MPQTRSGRCGDNKNLAPSEIEPRLSSSKPVAIPTELSRLLEIQHIFTYFRVIKFHSFSCSYRCYIQRLIFLLITSLHMSVLFTTKPETVKFWRYFRH
jgi:hypothetical protein